MEKIYRCAFCGCKTKKMQYGSNYRCTVCIKTFAVDENGKPYEFKKIYLEEWPEKYEVS